MEVCSSCFGGGVAVLESERGDTDDEEDDEEDEDEDDDEDTKKKTMKTIYEDIFVDGWGGWSTDSDDGTELQQLSRIPIGGMDI